MAVNGQEFTIKFSADTAQAQTEFKKFADAAKKGGEAVVKSGHDAHESAKGFESLEGKLVALEAAFELFKTVGEVFHKVAEAIEEPIKIAAQAEANNVRLATSLKLAGHGGEEALEGVHHFAEELQATAGVSEELVKKIVATNVAIGLTIPQAEEAAEAAAGLAKFTGTDLVSANEKLMASLTGSTRELQRISPAVMSLTMDQKRHGEAIKLVGQQLKTFVTADAQTALGVLDRLKLGWEDLQKKVGSYILTGLDAGGKSKDLSKVFEDLSGFIETNKQVFIDFGKVIGDFALSAVKNLAEAMKELGPILPNLGKQFGDLTGTFVVPFVHVLTSLSSIIAHFAGDKKLEDAMDRIGEKLTAFNKKSYESLAGINSAPSPDWDERLNTKGLESAVSKNNALLDGAKTGYKTLADETKHSIDQNKENLNAWGDLWDKVTSAFKDKAPTIVEPPHPEYFEAGPPKSAMSVGPGADLKIPAAAHAAEHAERASTGPINLPLTEQQMQKQIQMRRALNDQTLAIEESFGNELEASHNATFRKILQIEQDAAREGVSVSAASNKLKLAVDKKYLDDKRKQALADAMTSANMTGDLFGKNQAQYDLDVEAAQQALQKKHISQEAYVKAVEEADRKRTMSNIDTELGIANSTEDLAASAALTYAKDLATYQEYLDKKLISDEQYEKAKAQAGVKKDVAKGAAAQQWANNFVAEASIDTAVPMLGAADKVVDAIQRLIDFLPNFLNKVAGIFQGLRDLPVKLADAISNVFNSILSMFQNLPANLGKMFDRINDSAANFIEKLPDVMANFAAKIPYLINNMITHIPKLVKAFVKSAITEAPTMAIAMISSITQAMPSLIHSFIHMLMHELPAAFKEAIKAAIAELKAAFASLFGGKFKLPDFTPQLARVAEQLKGSASQIFNISDFKSAAKNVDIGDRVRDAISGSMINLAHLLGQLWRDLVAALIGAWRWIYDNIIQPIVNIIRSAWLWVYDNVIQPIITIVRAAWLWVYDNVIQPIEGVVIAAWQWVYTNVIQPIANVVISAWQWVYNNVIAPIFTAVTTAWMWVQNNIINPLWGTIVGAFLTVKNSVLDPIINSFGSLGSVFQPFANAVNSLLNWSWPSLPHLSAGGLLGSSGAGGAVSAVGNAIGGAAASVSHSLGFAAGGMVRGGILYAEGGTPVVGTDTVPAMLTPGEYVVNRHAVNRLGAGTLDQINSGNLPGRGSTNVNVSLTINTTDPIDANFVRSKLVPTLMEAIKSASENGRYVINTKGVRS